MEYPTGNQNFISQHEMTDRLILMYTGMHAIANALNPGGGGGTPI